MKAMIAALAFILEKATKNLCPVEDLEKEMLQLGFSPEHSKTLGSVYSREQGAITKTLSKSFIRGQLAGWVGDSGGVDSSITTLNFSPFSLHH